MHFAGVIFMLRAVKHNTPARPVLRPEEGVAGKPVQVGIESPSQKTGGGAKP